MALPGKVQGEKKYLKISFPSTYVFLAVPKIQGSLQELIRKKKRIKKIVKC